MLDASHVFRLWLQLAPTELHERLFALSLNHVLKGQALSRRIHELEGKRFRIAVQDVPIALTFGVVAGKVARTTREPDVTSRARLSALLALAKRAHDPDQLIFPPHLAVESRL